MVTLTLIRHGESQDNMKGIWAGWKDAPLSDLGQRQATALGSAFLDSSTMFTHLYTSDLLRAHTTALSVYVAHKEPKPFMTSDSKLREQHFGIAEGQTWTPDPPPVGVPFEELYKKGIFPNLKGRDAKFPEGESLNDVSRRAEEFIREYILPHLFDQTNTSAHLAFTSHGICMTELIAVLLRSDPEADCSKIYKGHLNTAWSRFEVSLRATTDIPLDTTSIPPLKVHLVTFNNCDHLKSIMSDISSNDLNLNEGARSFFAGTGVPMAAAAIGNATEDINDIDV